MKILFVSDTQEVLVASPEQLTLLQTSEGVSTLSMYSGQNEEDEPTYIHLINFPVNISAVQTVPVFGGDDAGVPVVEATPVKKTPAKKTRKKVSKG